MKILFATDGAKQSNAAIEMIKRLVIHDGDEITVVSVIDLAVPMAVDIYGGYVPDTTEFEKTARENATRILAETVEKLKTQLGEKNITISTELLFGSPESRIVELADEIKPELIVVGSHGYSGWERLLLGSVSDAVVHHAPCSVMVVRCPTE
ncbi:MAG: universal stress protein [Pyrinomonadaceae bacterium]